MDRPTGDHSGAPPCVPRCRRPGHLGTGGPRRSVERWSGRGLDRAIVAEKIGTEWDSYRYHNATSDRDDDSNRRARLVGAGWLTVPVTANTEPELVARAVVRAYQDRRGQAAGQAAGHSACQAADQANGGANVA